MGFCKNNDLQQLKRRGASQALVVELPCGGEISISADYHLHGGCALAHEHAFFRERDDSGAPCLIIPQPRPKPLATK